MNVEFIEALNALEKERGISKEVLMASAKGVLRVGGWGHHACYLSCSLVLGVKHR